MVHESRLGIHAENFKVAGHLVVSTFKDGKLTRQTAPLPNKVVAGAGGYGRNLIARHLAGDTTYQLAIDSAAVGDSNTAPTDADTGLGNSLVSGIDITEFTVSNNQLQVDVFVADGNLANDTYEEFGLFSNGRLFCRVIISPAYTKASGEDTLFTYTLTLSG